MSKSDDGYGVLSILWLKYNKRLTQLAITIIIINRVYFESPKLKLCNVYQLMTRIDF